MNKELFIAILQQLQHAFYNIAQCTTSWQSLEVGIPMGCARPPILFALAMEVIIRAAEKAGPGVSLPGSEELQFYIV